MPKLDAIDLNILGELQRDGRVTNVDLAARVGLSPSPCLTRVRALERSGVVGGYVALLDPKKLNLSLDVFVRVRLERQTENALKQFENAVNKHSEVMECYLMTGDSDYLIRIVVKDVSRLERFIVKELSTIPGIASIESSIALKQIKYKTALPLELSAEPDEHD